MERGVEGLYGERREGWRGCIERGVVGLYGERGGGVVWREGWRGCIGGEWGLCVNATRFQISPFEADCIDHAHLGSCRAL